MLYFDYTQAVTRALVMGSVEWVPGAILLSNTRVRQHCDIEQAHESARVKAPTNKETLELWRAATKRFSFVHHKETKTSRGQRFLLVKEMIDE